MYKYLYKITNYIVLILAICLFLMTIELHAVLVYNLVNKELLDEDKNLVKMFNNNVWNRYFNIINELADSAIDKAQWKENEQYVQFALDSFNFFNKYPAVKITIYNKKGDKLIATNKQVITSVGDQISNFKINNFKDISLLFDIISSYLNKYNLKHSISSTLEGNNVSRLNISTTYHDENGVARSGTLLTNYIAINNAEAMDNNLVSGVFEISRDITKQWANLSNIRFAVFCSCLVLLLIFYFTIYIHKKRAAKVISIQLEENKKLEEAKLNAEGESRKKSEFLANVSHELKTPLNIIIGFSDILKGEAFGPLANEKYKEYVNDIHVSGTHLLGLINDILDYSRASAGHLKIDCIPTDIRKVVNSAIRLITPKAEEAAVEIIKLLPDKNLIVLADQKRLKQALMNIISNSIKFTPGAGTVTITAHKTNDLDNNEIIELVIEDTGIGIAEKDLEKVMCSYGQVDSKLNRKYEGTGIGLPFTKTLVEMMNGKFKIESELGEGTKVTITFFAEKIENL